MNTFQVLPAGLPGRTAYLKLPKSVLRPGGEIASRSGQTHCAIGGFLKTKGFSTPFSLGSEIRNLKVLSLLPVNGEAFRTVLVKTMNRLT